MPLYEYECQACRRRFEIIQKFSDAPVEACPSCGAAVRKLLSPPAIQFKGSGWYVTDYARKSEGARPEAGKAEKSDKTSPSTDSTSTSSSGPATSASAGSSSKDS